jgi:hypothetical protein
MNTAGPRLITLPFAPKREIKWIIFDFSNAYKIPGSATPDEIKKPTDILLVFS